MGDRQENSLASASGLALTGVERWVILLSLFAVALALRLHNIKELPLPFHPVRQYRSAFIARAYYYRSLPTLPEWKRGVAEANAAREPQLEPPIVEFLTYLLFQVAGRESLWIPRVMSSLFWIAGGLFLYLLARRVSDPQAALLSVGFYLLLPFGVLASRSFQPDPLMVMLLEASLLLIVRYFDQPSAWSLARASLTAALAMLVKPMCAFLIFSAFVACTVSENGVRATLRRWQSWAFAVFSLTPAALYYLRGVLSGGNLNVQAQRSFLPHLFLKPFYWLDWLGMIDRVVGATFLVLGLVGVLVVRPGLSRAVLLGLWTGYVFFGLVFNYHIHTHDYYQLQLIPAVALSLGPVAGVLLSQVSAREPGGRRGARWAGLCLVAGLAVGGSVRNVWEPLNAIDRDPVTVAQQVGEHAEHSRRCLFLSYAYGKVVKYHGEVSGIAWPELGEMQRAERLRGPLPLTMKDFYRTHFHDFAPEFFIVTDMAEYDRQTELAEYLTKNFPVLAKDSRYLVFDLRRRLPALE